MVLLILGLMSWDEVTDFNFWFDPTHAKGKFWGMLDSKPGLFRDCTDLKGLQKHLHKSYGSTLLTTAEATGSADELIEFITERLQADQPVIVGVRYSATGGHWLVVIGYEEDTQGNISKLLALDSSATAPQLCAWNAYIDLTPIKGKQYKYSWVRANDIRLVKLDDALAVGKA